MNNKLPNTKEIIKQYVVDFQKTKKNIMRAPKLTHVTISAGCGKYHKDNSKIAIILDDLSSIAGQKAVIAKAKKSVSNFGIREGMTSGCYVTLRGEKMYAFLDQLVTIALPRIPEFSGLSVKSIAKNTCRTLTHLNGKTNMNVGIKSHHVFPVVNISDKVNIGINVSIGVKGAGTAISDIVDLFKAIGFPFRDSLKGFEIEKGEVCH